MVICADSNLLISSVNRDSSFYPTAKNAISSLLSRGDRLIVFPQNLIEFWAVATRPVASNGLGFSSEQTTTEIKQIRSIFHLVLETAEIYPEWQRLVEKHEVMGKNVHDARIAAQMTVNDIANILTFNPKDFVRYANINVIEPESV